MKQNTQPDTTTDDLEELPVASEECTEEAAPIGPFDAHGNYIGAILLDNEDYSMLWW